MLLVDRLHLEEEVKVLNGKFLEHEGYFFNLAYLCKKLEADGKYPCLHRATTRGLLHPIPPKLVPSRPSLLPPLTLTPLHPSPTHHSCLRTVHSISG